MRKQGFFERNDFLASLPCLTHIVGQTNLVGCHGFGKAVASLSVESLGIEKVAEGHRAGTVLVGRHAEVLGRLVNAQAAAVDAAIGKLSVAAFPIAGLAAEGITIVDDIKYIQRGYENFDEKIRGLGGQIQQVSSEREAMKFRMRVG